MSNDNAAPLLDLPAIDFEKLSPEERQEVIGQLKAKGDAFESSLRGALKEQGFDPATVDELAPPAAWTLFGAAVALGKKKGFTAQEMHGALDAILAAESA